ncbi:MAG: hypothetical protein ACYYKD_08665 [Rhodospirillales bacterium]
MSWGARAALGLSAVCGGAAIAWAMVWIFGLETADAEKLAAFPAGWTVLEILTHACAVMMFVGGTRAIYVGVSRTVTGNTDTPPRA